MLNLTHINCESLKANWDTGNGIYPTWLLNASDSNLSRINVKNHALTGSFSITHRPNPNLQLNFLASSGFRSPNIDDVGKVREKSGLVTVPNVDLRPEFAYNLEGGILKYFNAIWLNGLTDM